MNSALIRCLPVAVLLLGMPAQAQTPVLADFSVTQSLVALVTGAEGPTLLDHGADPHDVQLRPSQARALAQAGAVVWMGEGLSPGLAGAVAGAGGSVLDLSAVPGLTVQGFRASVLLGEAEDGHDHGHEGHGHEEHGHEEHGHDEHGHDEHGHDEHAHDDHAGHGHAHGDTDPHLWLDPVNAQVMLGAIAEHLAALDPALADTYRANAAAAQAQIAALDAELAALLAPARDTGLVVFHDAYGYFASHYGLNLLGAIAAGDAAAPGAQRLATIRAALEGRGDACLFPEIGHSDRMPALVAEGTGLRLGAPLDPEGRGLEPGAGLYAALMRGMAQAIADCANG